MTSILSLLHQYLPRLLTAAVFSGQAQQVSSFGLGHTSGTTSAITPGPAVLSSPHSPPRVSPHQRLLSFCAPTISESGHLPRPSVSNHIFAPRSEPDFAGAFSIYGHRLSDFFAETRQCVTSAQAQPQATTREKRTTGLEVAPTAKRRVSTVRKAALQTTTRRHCNIDTEIQSDYDRSSDRHDNAATVCLLPAVVVSE